MELLRYQQSGLIIGDVAVDIGSFTPLEAISEMGVEALLVTHLHADHFEVQRAAALGVPVFGPPDVCKLAADAGLEAHTLSVGQPTTVVSVTVTAFAVDHGLISTPIDNFGYRAETRDGVLLVVGDAFNPVVDAPIADVDVVVIPIGGGKVFDVTLATEQLRAWRFAQIVVPCHYSEEADLAAFVRVSGAAAWTCAALDVGEQLKAMSS